MLSPSEQFADFLGQLPVLPFAMVCGAVIFLFMAFAWFAYIKPVRNKRSKSASTSTPYDDFGADLPDLGTLLDPSSLEHHPTSIRSGENYHITLRDGSTVDAIEVISVLRDTKDGRLIVQLGNTGYRNFADVPEVKKNFLKIMREVGEIVNESTQAGTQGASSSIPENNMPAPRPAAPQAPAVPLAAKPVSSAPPPPVTADGGMPGDLPKFNLDESLVQKQSGLFGKAVYEPVPVPELNIAASIEAYLQHKLRHTPEYAGREIHVHSAPGGGVRIQVDSAFFEAVSDVTNPEVREFLSSTIQEWQDRQ